MTASRPDPYACPLADPPAGRVCPHRFYPEHLKGAPDAWREHQVHSECRRSEGCLAPARADA